jgi:hypothetical protein
MKSVVVDAGTKYLANYAPHKPYPLLSDTFDYDLANVFVLFVLLSRMLLTERGRGIGVAGTVAVLGFNLLRTSSQIQIHLSEWSDTFAQRWRVIRSRRTLADCRWQTRFVMYTLVNYKYISCR